MADRLRLHPLRARSFVFGLLLLLVFGVSVTVRAAPSPEAAPVQPIYYLPLIHSPYPSPTLVAPANGARLNTLAPEFQWVLGPQPGDAFGCVALDTQPQPTFCYYWFLISDGTDHWATWGNLPPKTKFYWRVGVTSDFNSPNFNWSEERTFTTGNGGQLPAAPALLKPADNANLTVDQLIFSWNAVAGAKEYSVFIYDPALNQGPFFTTNTPEFDARSSHLPLTLTKEYPYEWQVMVRNEYGWSIPSSSRRFTLKANAAPGQPVLSEQGLGGMQFLQVLLPDGSVGYRVVTGE